MLTKTRFFHLLFIATCLLVSHAKAEDDEVTKAKGQLKRQLELLQRIEPFVERLELARLKILESQTNKVLKTVNESGLSHAATFREYQHLIVAYRFSVAYFKEIQTEISSQWIIEVQTIAEDIAKARGFDDEAYTKITYSVFSQIHQLLLQLVGSTQVPAELIEKVQVLIPKIGEVMAFAQSNGDRRLTYPVATPVYREIEKLYPDFNKIMSSNAAFNIILEIQGLAEFYADFAQEN